MKFWIEVISAWCLLEVLGDLREELGDNRGEGEKRRCLEGFREVTRLLRYTQGNTDILTLCVMRMYLESDGLPFYPES